MSSASGLRVEGQMPSLDGAVGWLNSEPLDSSELRGRVVLVDFWTYTCINWIRTLPYVRAWAEKYSGFGLVMIGVHTPEFAFEKDVDNIRRATAAMRVDYPIAIDSDYAVWRAFDNQYWPALYFVDAEGDIRHHAFGEGDYERSETVIQRLLGEAGAKDVPDEFVSVEGRGVEAAADWNTLRTPETYLGYLRAEGFASPGGAVFDVPHVYGVPEHLRLNQWALAGEWTIRGQPAVLNRADGRIVHRFEARDVHLVMAPGQDGAPVRFRVLIDGKPPNGAHGLDIDEQGAGTVNEPRLYQLIRQPGRVTEHTFEIVFLDTGVQACVFTFG